MRVVFFALLLLSAACSQPQPGCSIANCEAMISACRIEFHGAPQEIATCVGFDHPPGPVDYGPYCVAACNAHPGAGVAAQCFADKADACRSAFEDGGISALDAVIDSCAPTTPSAAPLKTCDDDCTAKRGTCDTACSGGKPCDLCVREGRKDCANFCTDAGYKSCLDCSSRCGIAYVQCSDQCPREL